MPKAYALAGKVVAVTGAGSGIGRALALELAARGCRLALADRNAQTLAETVALLGPREILSCELDVADRAAVFDFAARVEQRYGHADVIINNAGVAVSQTIAELDPADLEWIFSVNFWGVVHGTQAFLPRFKSRNSGVVVNLSSVFGFVAWPGQGAYCATKFAVRGFTETLQHELRDAGTAVRALCVMPGGIRTGIVRNSRYRLSTEPGSHAAADELFQQRSKTTPEAAAAQIVRALESGRPSVVIGGDAKVLQLLQRLLPQSYYALLKALLL